MPDDITVNEQGLQTDLSQPGDPTTQTTPPNPDVVQTVSADWNQTKSTITFNGNIYSLTLIGQVQS